MNSKTARKVRKIAAYATAGVVDRCYRVDRDGAVRLQRGCTRGVYQNMKRAVDHGLSVVVLERSVR